MLREEYRAIAEEVDELYGKFALSEQVERRKYKAFYRHPDHFTIITGSLLSSLDAEVKRCELDLAQEAKNGAERLVELVRKYCGLFADFPEFRGGEFSTFYLGELPRGSYPHDSRGFFTDIAERWHEDSESGMTNLAYHPYYILESEKRLRPSA